MAQQRELIDKIRSTLSIEFHKLSIQHITKETSSAID